MGRTSEAEQAMSEALNEWQGKAEQEQLLISQAQILVSKGDPDGALAILQKVQPGQLSYHSARIKMAEIYIEEKKDKRMFAACYKELLQMEPTPASYAMLGDAFMSIQEPDEAISYYEQALKMQNKDALLAEKIGEAYVMSHLYAKAVNFYESTMNIYKDRKMREKLAELLLKLGSLDKCEKVLKQPLDLDPDPADLTVLPSHIQLLELLSKVHQARKQWNEASDCLDRAKRLQLRLMTKSETNTNFNVKREVARILCLMAELQTRTKDITRAVELYKQATTFHEGDIKSNLALAHIYMSQNRLQLCNQQCNIVLAIERDNDEATLMMADLLYLKNEGDQAIVHFTQLLTRNPNHYHALARVIELSWRGGDAENAEKFLMKAVEANPRATVDAGYNYCKGLHEWFTGDPNGALQAFNRARRDLTWGEKAIYNMIEICLNPDNEIIGGEVLESSEDKPEDADRAMGTKTAEKFLKELRYKPTVDSRYSLMENFILMHTGNKMNIQTALNAFLSMIGEGDTISNVGAVLGTARAYMILKQVPKAKTILKKVISHQWTLENADYLEKCWLLLADLYINQNKTDQATNVLRTVLHHNASSLKAFEFQGYLREKEQKWAEAVQHYEKAWRICQQRNPAIGYKLAYNYFKCRRLFTCIETCHKVLEQYPHYPKIKKEIMDKARALIRT
ncbi:unnamed protein product [Caenorhabditis auriculariae]|uniref:Tetratricopeptide repeat protein 21B n=1 Tax=Caenorhabditis auriculariae TaxID=2777116 RepID=A0A8S1HSF5_9PELO|nr:unnamed protein product [Caenorhabditis auriculariae]